MGISEKTLPDGLIDYQDSMRRTAIGCIRFDVEGFAYTSIRSIATELNANLLFKMYTQK